MSTPDTLICRPTKWFLWRAVAMLVLFGVFAALFFKDWKVGYPKKNLVYYTYQAFENARQEFREREEAGQSAAAWEAFAGAQTIPFPEDAGLVPEGTDLNAPWPAILVDYEAYKPVFEEGDTKKLAPGWLDYSDQRGWSSDPPKAAMDAGTIKEQFYFGLLCAVLTLLALFYLFRTGRRCMAVDGEAFHAPDGTRIPYDKMRRIDARKWAAKGLAYIYYEGKGEGLQKAKVDGMVYGQFREEDGAPAEALYQTILKNFSGELVELEPIDDAEEESAAEEEAKG